MESREAAVKLFRNMRRISSHPASKRIIDATRGEMMVLMVLRRNGPMTPGQLMQKTGSSSAHIAKILRKLAFKGAVTRKIDCKDKRSIMAELTREGEILADGYLENLIGMVAAMLDGLKEEKRNRLVETTDEILEIISIQEE